MKKSAVLVLAAMAVVLAGVVSCVPVSQTVTLRQPFDKAQAERLLRPGNNTIKVNAFMRQMGGGVVTCAGQEVILIPATKMAEERMAALYGSVNGGIRPVGLGGLKFENEAPEYENKWKTAICSSDGRAIFSKVADGDFYIVTGVVWTVQYPQGGNLSKRISVKGGETLEVVLSN